MNRAETLEHHFSFDTGKTIWKTLADPKHTMLFLEIRDKSSKTVSFSELDMANKRWLWQNVTFDEPWWISMNAFSNDVLLFTLYTNQQNPDEKSTMAFDTHQQKILWWKNKFVVSFASGDYVTGVETKFGSKETVFDVKTGDQLPAHDLVLIKPENFQVTRPLQYTEGTSYFETVREFIERKCGFSPVISVEYCEHRSLIFISAYKGQTDLANYLIVFNSKGDLVLDVTLGEDLKGIAPDTFFIIPGYLIFVKNKSELISYRIV